MTTRGIQESVLPPESPFSPVPRERVLAENDIAVAFLDGYPLSEGHALIVPKQVVACLFDLPELEQAAVWALAAQTRSLLQERFCPDGFTVGINDGAAAGQTIAHAHVHMIPRYEGDVPDPRGGIRWVIPDRARYWEDNSARNGRT